MCNADETMVEKGKPDPEIYLKAANELQAHSEQCLVVEDSISGIKAAKSAGMQVLAITTTHSHEELQPLADWTIIDFDEFRF